MFRRLGLTRDPYHPDPDPALYWENRPRKTLRHQAETALEHERGIWISGPPGAGRSAFAWRLAAGMARSGRAVLAAPEPPAGWDRGLMGWLHRVAGAEGEPTQGEDGIQALSARILRRYWLSGPVILLPAGRPLTRGELQEVLALAGLCVKGQPIMLPILLGEGPTPTPSLESVELAPLTPEELESCLTHRALLSGRANPVPEEALRRAARRAAGVGEALALARAELSRHLFFPAQATAAAASGPAPDTLFPETQMKELGRLLDAISSEPVDG